MILINILQESQWNIKFNFVVIRNEVGAFLYKNRNTWFLMDRDTYYSSLCNIVNCQYKLLWFVCTRKMRMNLVVGIFLNNIKCLLCSLFRLVCIPFHMKKQSRGSKLSTRETSLVFLRYWILIKKCKSLQILKQM